MERFRIGNDVKVTWPIITNGEAVELAGRDLTLYLIDRYGGKKRMDFSRVGNAVVCTFLGTEQKLTGIYTLTLIENNGKVGMATIDKVQAFQLIPRDPSDTEKVLEEVTLTTGYLQVGVQGMSAYEIAVRHGYQGTEAEWISQYMNAEERATVIINETTEGEEARQQAEQERQDAEAARQQAERDREGVEQQRQNTFESNERERQDQFDDGQQSRQETFESDEAQRQHTFDTNENKRQSDFEKAESNRKKGETERQANEEERKVAEDERQHLFDESQQERNRQFSQAQDTREQTFNDNESQRQQTHRAAQDSRQHVFEQDEAIRQQTFNDNEARRIGTFDSNEAQRQKTARDNQKQWKDTFEENESQRQQTADDAELQRATTFAEGEASREHADDERQANEEVRKANEVQRRFHESDREKAEQRRAEEHSGRTADWQNKKNQLDADNTSYSEAERLRKLAEAERASAEEQRQANETVRQQRQSGYATSESERQGNETTRGQQEATRQQNEQQRIQNEADRQANESDRSLAELRRQANETLRQRASINHFYVNSEEVERGEGNSVDITIPRRLQDLSDGNRITALENALDTLIGSDDVTEAIDNFNEVKAFLAGIQDTTLQTLLTNIQNAVSDGISGEKTRAEGVEQALRNLITALRQYVDTELAKRPVIYTETQDEYDALSTAQKMEGLHFIYEEED